MTTITKVSAQQLDQLKIAAYEDSLDDVMEIIDQDLVKVKLKEVTTAYEQNPNELNKVRLGLIYHEIALNLTFFYNTKEYAGYAQKSFDVLTELSQDTSTTPELLVFIESYRGSALSLVVGETKKLSLLSDAFKIFKTAIDQFGDISPRPEFMRGSVAENLPKIFWRKKKYAKIDFESIIQKQKKNKSYADFKIMSFSYWAWARANNKMKHRKQAIAYLDKAIALDPNYLGGRQRAEELKKEYQSHK